MSAIVVEDLVKRYDGFTAVEDVSFTAAAGEVTALLGPNGAGKTTTIEIRVGFPAPTAGTIRVRGTDPRARGRDGDRAARAERRGQDHHGPHPVDPAEARRGHGTGGRL